jgi:hypothetical protein
MRLPPLLRRVLAEPLAQFLVIGLALFAVYEAVGGDRGPEGSRIVVDRPLVDQIAERYRLVWQREPTPAELRALIEEHVRDEVFFREGVAAGLEMDDVIIRRRVRQKLEVLAEESGEDTPANDAALEAYLDANATRYAAPVSLDVEQIFFDSAKAGPYVAEVAARDALRTLEAGGRAPAGDTSLLPRRAQGRRPAELEAVFGETFADAVTAIPVGRWQGPVISPFGAHIVRVIARTPGKTPQLAEVRDAVVRDWEAARRKRALESYYRRVRERYQIEFAKDLPAGTKPR